MMADMMTFPNTVEEFMEQYKIVDTEKIYTNGAELVPIFRMMQWFDHVSATDTISRQAALEIMAKWLNDVCGMREIEGVKLTPLKQLRELHAAQPVLTCKGCKYDYYEYAQCRNCLRKERDLYEPE